MTSQAEGLGVILPKVLLRVGCHFALASRAGELQCWRLQCYRNGDCSCTNCVRQSVKISWKLWISQHPGWARLGLFISTWHCTNAGTQVQCVRCFPERYKFCALIFLQWTHLEPRSDWVASSAFWENRRVANGDYILWLQTFSSCLLTSLSAGHAVCPATDGIPEKALR